VVAVTTAAFFLSSLFLSACERHRHYLFWLPVWLSIAISLWYFYATQVRTQGNEYLGFCYALSFSLRGFYWLLDDPSALYMLPENILRPFFSMS
jgi:hypothetical protein